MLVVRFKVQCKPERTDQALAWFQEVVATSRHLDGTIHFDIGRDLTDPDSFLALEVFADRAPLDRQESLPRSPEDNWPPPGASRRRTRDDYL